MPNPQLSDEQRAKANKLLGEIRERIQQLAANDPDLIFAYRRKIYKELSYDERGKPTKRKRLKLQLLKAGGGKCVSCGETLPERGSVLDRSEAKAGYVPMNVELICRACDAKRQGTKGYS